MFTYVRTYVRRYVDADDVGLLPFFSPAAEAKGLQSTRARIEPGTWAEMPGPRPGPKPGPMPGPMLILCCGPNRNMVVVRFPKHT